MSSSSSSLTAPSFDDLLNLYRNQRESAQPTAEDVKTVLKERRLTDYSTPENVRDFCILARESAKMYKWPDSTQTLSGIHRCMSHKWKEITKEEVTYSGVVRVLSAVGSKELVGHEKTSSLKRVLHGKTQGDTPLDEFAVEMVGLYNRIGTLSGREKSIDFLSRIDEKIEKKVMSSEPDLNDFLSVIALAKTKWIKKYGVGTPQLPQRSTVTWGTNSVIQRPPAAPSLPSSPWSVHHVATSPTTHGILRSNQSEEDILSQVRSIASDTLDEKMEDFMAIEERIRRLENERNCRTPVRSSGVYALSSSLPEVLQAQSAPRLDCLICGTGAGHEFYTCSLLINYFIINGNNIRYQAGAKAPKCVVHGDMTTHDTNSCFVVKMLNSRYRNIPFCSNCKEQGHLMSTCTNQTKGGFHQQGAQDYMRGQQSGRGQRLYTPYGMSQPPPPPVCFNCGRQGHKAMHCSSLPQSSTHQLVNPSATPGKWYPQWQGHGNNVSSRVNGSSFPPPGHMNTTSVMAIQGPPSTSFDYQQWLIQDQVQKQVQQQLSQMQQQGVQPPLPAITMQPQALQTPSVNLHDLPQTRHGLYIDLQYLPQGAQENSSAPSGNRGSQQHFMSGGTANIPTDGVPTAPFRRQ